jgi:hypothetical protein
MSKKKSLLKKTLCKSHREERYFHAINKVIDGRASPSYATLRWEKLREVK